MVILVIVRYSTDSERKRVEYLIDKYSDRLRFRRPSGLVLFVDGDTNATSEFLEELLARVDPGIVEVYNVNRSAAPDPTILSLEVMTNFGCEEALGAFGFVMARLRGALLHEVGGMREYIVRSRKGQARVRVRARNVGSGCLLVVDVEGYGPGVEYVYRVLSRELSVVGEVRVK